MDHRCRARLPATAARSDDLIRVIAPSAEVLRALRTAFVAMVTINADGQFVRKSLACDAIPELARPVAAHKP